MGASSDDLGSSAVPEVQRTALAEKVAAAKARKEEPAASAKFCRQAVASPRKRGADADDDTGVAAGRRRSVDKSMPSGGPLERATAAHGALGSLLPKGAAEGAVGRLTRTESAAETAAEVALAPINDPEFLEGNLENKHLPAEVVRERRLRFPKEARLPL